MSDTAGEKPDTLMDDIDRLTREMSRENIETLYQSVDGYRQWVDDRVSWGQFFMDDSELNWMQRHTPIDDL